MMIIGSCINIILDVHVHIVNSYDFVFLTSYWDKRCMHVSLFTFAVHALVRHETVF